jgi:hypothetical protein
MGKVINSTAMTVEFRRSGVRARGHLRASGRG